MEIVLEDPKGRPVGIEVKTAAVVGSEDFKGLRVLGEAGASIFTEERNFLFLIAQKIIKSSWSVKF